MTTNWRQVPEAGTATAIRFLVWVARVPGRKFLHILLAPISLYFVLVRSADRRASRAYLERVFGKPVGFWQIYRHFYCFARVVADRFYFIGSDTDGIPVRVYGADKLQVLVDEGRGGIVLSAHLGSFEAARFLSARLSNVVLRMILDRRVNQNLVSGLESVSPDFKEAIIDLNQSPPALALQISDALKRGEWIGFLADRMVESGRSETVDFLGDPVKFPVGPYAIAGIFKVPLVCVFPLYIEGGYEVHCEVISESASIPRATRDEDLRRYVESFANRLEKYVHMAPYNWFNFFDFWNEK